MRYSILFIGLFFSLLTYSQSRTISKVKEDFSQGKYAEGLDRLASLSKDPSEKVIQFYYRALYFSIPNNPKYELDSAYVCVDLSEQQFKLLSEKDQNSFCSEYAICKNRYEYYKDSLTKEIYTELVKKKDIEGLQKYCINYPKSSVLQLAVSKIEDLKFELASANNDLILLNSFLIEYPKSKYINQVNTLREKLNYEKALKENTISVYRDFLNEFKDSKFKTDILNHLETLEYAKVRKENTIANYKLFLTQFPSSKYKMEIDSIVYQQSYEEVLSRNDIVSIELFFTEYPNGRHSIELNQLLDNMYYEQAKNTSTIENLNTYCNKYPFHTLRYQEIHQLLEKLSFEQAKNTNTKNEWEQFIEKFPNSKYISDAKVALGELFTVAPFLTQNGRMEFRDVQTNTKLFDEDFEFIYPFYNGKALVVDNKKTGLIDEKGNYLITPIYDKIEIGYEANLFIATKLKSELIPFWQVNSDDVYKRTWSKQDISSLKEFLLDEATYNAVNSSEQSIFRKYLGSLISYKYDSYSDFRYYSNETEYQNLVTRAEEEFKMNDIFVYIFCEAPFAVKKVDEYSITETFWDFSLNRSSFEYTVNQKTYVLEYSNNTFIERGTTDRLVVYDKGVKIICEGRKENEEEYFPGNYYLEAQDGYRITKQEFNAIQSFGNQSEYFLCHQGGEFEQYKGFSWNIIGGKWGVINKLGQIILPVIFDELVPVDSFEINPYFIATTNKIIPTEYNDYSASLGNVGLINIEGKELIPYKDGYNLIHFYNRNTIVVRKNAILGYLEDTEYEMPLILGGLAGVVNIERKVILPLEFNEIEPINNYNQFIIKKGLKLVKSSSEGNFYKEVGGKNSLVNRNNQYLIPTPIENLTSELIGCVGCIVDNMGNPNNGKWGIINESGKTVVPFNYSYIESTPIKGVFIVNIGKASKKVEYGYEDVAEGKVGLVRNNTLMTQVKYNSISTYNHYFEAELGSVTEYFNINCQPLSFKCDGLSIIEAYGEESTEYIAYRIGAKWGIVNTNFEKITEPIFWGDIDGDNNSDPFEYRDGYFLVNQGGLKYYVSKKGKILKD
jgi:TolA-binding protein